MRNTPRKGLQDIRTRGSLTGDAENPQRKFLHIASLELKKSLCNKVRDAARKRSAEMDRKIAELDDEKARLLAASQIPECAEANPTAGRHPASDGGLPERRGFALKY
jgi:hypothetical protein